MLVARTAARCEAHALGGKAALSSECELDAALRERGVWAMLQDRPCSGVVALTATYQDRSSLYMLRDAVTGGSLRDLTKRFPGYVPPRQQHR